MKLVVYRISSEKDCTNGVLFEKTDSFGLRFLCYTLEDEHRVLKVKGETRIPKGKYNIEYRKEGGFHNKYSKRFSNIHKGMLQVMDVPNFDYILLHCGNSDENTAGCLLLGDSQENNQIIKDGFIGKSTNAYKRVYKEISERMEKGEDVTIEYIDFDKQF